MTAKIQAAFRTLPFVRWSWLCRLPKKNQRRGVGSWRKHCFVGKYRTMQTWICCPPCTSTEYWSHTFGLRSGDALIIYNSIKKHSKTNTIGSAPMQNCFISDERKILNAALCTHTLTDTQFGASKTIPYWFLELVFSESRSKQRHDKLHRPWQWM